MRVTCHQITIKHDSPGKLAETVNRLIDLTEHGPDAARVVAASVQLYNSAGQVNRDFDWWLVTLSTTSGPAEQGR